MVDDCLRDGLVSQEGVILTAVRAGVVTDRDRSVVKIVPFLLLLIKVVLQEGVTVGGMFWSKSCSLCF